MVDDRGLVISALCGDLGRLWHPGKNPALIENPTILDRGQGMGSDILPRISV